MNFKQETVVAYLDFIENENELYNIGDEFPSYFGGFPLYLNPIAQNQLPVCSKCGKILKFLLQSKLCLRNQVSVKVYRMQSENLSIDCNQAKYEEQRFSEDKLMVINPEFITPEENIQQIKIAKCLLPKNRKQNNKQHRQQKQQQFYDLENNDDDQNDENENEDNEKQWNNNDFQQYTESNNIQYKNNQLFGESSQSSDDDDNLPQLNNKNIHENKLYEQYLSQNQKKSKIEQAIDMCELQELEKMNQKNIDGNFLIYQHFLMEYENHVIRYCFDKDTEPLWFSDKQTFTRKDISRCNWCNSERIFEFQINNSLLSFSKELYSLEWGAIFIYSCPNSCKTDQLWIEEYIMIQYDDHEEQFSDVSLDSQQIQSQISKTKNDNKKKTKMKKQLIDEKESTLKEELIDKEHKIQDSENDW